MNVVSKTIGLQPDILEGATIVKAYGDEYVLIENYKSIIEYSEEVVKIQGKHVKIVLSGEAICIEAFDADECRVTGKITDVQLIRL